MQPKPLNFQCFQAEGMGLEPTTPVRGHLISSEAASQFAYPPFSDRIRDRVAGDFGAGFWGIVPSLVLLDNVGAAYQVDEVLVRLELTQLGGELFHGVHVMHGRERAAEHCDRVQGFG